jgi:hypothetical protein
VKTRKKKKQRHQQNQATKAQSSLSLHPAFIGHHQQTIPQKFSKQPSPKLIHHLLNFRLQYYIKTNFKPSVSIPFPKQYLKHQQPHLFTQSRKPIYLSYIFQAIISRLSRRNLAHSRCPSHLTDHTAYKSYPIKI